MIVTPSATPADLPAADHPRRIVAAATVLGWLLLAALIGASYVGHSPSPYGSCHTATGRSVSCELLRR